MSEICNKDSKKLYCIVSIEKQFWLIPFIDNFNKIYPASDL